jgi:2-C-methyl-D-erythritol 4-phosphate cytidylyltransferase
VTLLVLPLRFQAGILPPARSMKYVTKNEKNQLPDAERVGAVIVSAGASTRMAGVDKTLVELGAMPLIARTVGVFERCEAVGSVVLVVARLDLSVIIDLVRDYEWTKVLHVLVGGQRRQDSVRIGLLALPECDWVVIHDGARPLVTSTLIEKGILTAMEAGAAAAAVPVVDTIKIVTDDGRVVETVDRRTIAAIQTPQVFRRDLLQSAHDEIRADVTDDSSMLETQGVPVQVFLGDRTNIKVTTPEDLVIAEELLRARVTSP